MFNIKLLFSSFSFIVFLIPNIAYSELRTAQYAALDYDVVYVRCPRAKEPVMLGGRSLYNWNGVNDLWLSASNNIYQQPGCDLMLHKSGFPAGDPAAEEVLVSCDENNIDNKVCSIVDPNVSFDGRYVAYTKFEDTRNFISTEGMLQSTAGVTSHYQRFLEIFPNGDGPKGGSWSYAEGFGVQFKAFDSPAHVYLYDLQEKREILVSPEDSFMSGHAFPGKSEDWVSNVPVMDTGPFFMSNGKIGFTSNRESGFYKFQLFSMDIDGSNLEMLGHRAMSQQLHPSVLKDGRIMYTSSDSMLYKSGNNNYSLFTINPDGSNPFILAGKQDPTFFTYHFATQLSDGDIVSTIYYNRNNVGLGTFLRFPVDPEGANFVHLTDKNEPFVSDGNWVAGLNLRPFSRVGQYQLTSQAHSADYPAQSYREAYGFSDQDEWIHPDGHKVTMLGKFSHPSAAPGNDLLATYAIGGASQTHDDFSTLLKTKEVIGKDAGIWLFPLDSGVKQNINHIADDGLLVVDSPDYHEIMPRPVVTYERIYGVKKPDPSNLLKSPKNDGLLDPRLVAGEPFGLTGAATLYDRETMSLNGTPWNVNASANRGGRNYMNLETSGADLAVYTNDEIAGIRVLLPMPAHPKDLPSGIEKLVGTGNYLRILGEYPVLKSSNGEVILDEQGNPDTSFVIKLPADTPFLFQTIDKRGMALDIETASRTVSRGEQQFCGGCHVHTRESINPFQSAAKLDINWLADFSGEDIPLLSGIDSAGNIVTSPLKQVYSADLVPGVESRKSFGVDWANGISQLIERRCSSCHGEGQSAQTLTGLRLDGDSRTYDLIASNSYLREDGVRINSSTKPGDGLLDVANGTEGTDRITSRFGCCTASRWLSVTSARSSMLVWALWGERLDGRDNVTGLPAEGSGVIVDPYGKEHPEIWPKVSEHAGYLLDMPESEKRLIARWIDIGAPKYNIHDDMMRPVLTITPVKEGEQITKLLVGVWDDSPIDFSRFSVKWNGDEIMNGTNVSGKPNVIEVSLPVAISSVNADTETYEIEIWDKPDRSLSLISPGVSAANRTRKTINGRGLLNLADAAPNSAPVYTAAVVAVEQGIKTSFFPTVNDPDAGNSHFYAIVTQPLHGVASIENNRLVYLPNSNYLGPDSFKFRATDLGGLSVEGTATINVVEHVNKAPTVSTLSLTGYSEQVISGTPIILDPDVGDIYTISIISQPVNGTASVSGNNVQYTPNTGYSGAESFTIRVTDAAGLFADGVVNVNVQKLPLGGNGNVAPTNVSAKLQGYSGQIIISSPAFLDANVNDSHVVSVISQPSNGLASIENGQLTYVSDAGYAGKDWFIFRVTDSGGLWAEGVASVYVNAIDSQLPIPMPEPEPEPEPETPVGSDVQTGGDSVLLPASQTDGNKLEVEATFFSAIAINEIIGVISFMLLGRYLSVRRRKVI